LHIGDFGLARSLQAPSLTRTGECVGTPLYMAPEQISAGEMPIDHRVDVYGLGATLYELLTLRPPFTAENREQVLTKIAERSPIPPRRINRRVPRDLQTICLKALEKRPGDRYQSAADMASDLRAFVARYSISAKPAGPLTLAMKWTQRHRVLCIWIGVATVLAAAAIGLGLRTRQLEARWTSARQQQVFEGALMAALEGKIEDATAAVDAAEHLGAPPDRIHLLQGQVELMAGNPEVAHEHFERAAEMMPDSVTAQALLAYSCLTRQQYDRGERLVQHLDQLTPVTLEDYLFKARAEAFFDPEAAAETLDRAVERGRRSLVARLIRGEVQTTRAMDNADPTLAKAALDDYQLAHEMLGATPLVSMNYLRALLVASTTYEVCGMLAERDAVLKRAAQISAELAAVDTAPAHHRRALYLDYIGRDQEAIDEWHKIQDKNVLFQAITLLRLGRLDEAAALGDQFGGQQSPDRMMTFIAALIAAATSDSAEDFAGRFPLEAEQPMSAIHELLAVYTVSCLTGQPAVARREALRLKQEGRFPTMLHRWYRRLEEYACQEITADQLLEFAGPSRKKQCEGHYYIGMTELCKGDREAAWQHFRASSALRVFTFYEYHLSRAMAAQLERDPTWPAWIPRQPL
jgi:tetratricopeptide (TPR) repeat protein